MPLFKNINYGKMLYEALRGYFSVNAAGEMSILYRFCAACIAPLQGPFDAYAAQRQINEIIANCKFQIGQLTNVLNYLYDSVQNRIFITQSAIQTLSAPEFNYVTTMQTQEFDTPATRQAREFNDSVATTAVIFNVPVGISIPAITATIEQIKIDGPPYTIIQF